MARWHWPRWHWPGWRLAGLAMAAGALAAIGQAPFGLWPLALAGFAAITALVARAGTARRGAWLALFAGAGHFGLALSWIVEPFLIDVARHGWMAPFAVVLLSFGLALFWGLAGAVAGRGRWPAAGFALALLAVEWLRGHVLTGFPWALPGHIWIGTPMDQLAALAGPYGLTALTLGLAAAPVLWGGRGIAVAGATLAAAAGFGLMRLDQPLPADRPVMLRLVQPNAEQHLKWDPDLARSFFDRLLRLTATPAPGGQPPDLTIWPETAVPYLMEEGDAVATTIAAAAGGRPVALGVQRVEPAGMRFWNSLRVVGPGGQITATYDKHHLVPFGEYIPFGDLVQRLTGITAFAAQSGSGYSAGPGAQVIDLGPTLGQVLPIICYEAVFPQDLRAAPERADWVLQITNDAWFGTMTGPFQHFAQARLRAIEQGLPLVRVANTGVTAVVDARGRLRAELPFGTEGALDAALPALLPATPYARWGDWPVLVLLAGLALWVFGSGRRAAP